MVVKLKIVRGLLRNRHGDDIGPEIAIRGNQFAIGTDAQCQLRCCGAQISPRHCVIEIESDRIVVRDYSRSGGTYVNGKSIERTSCLFNQDRLRIGKLEFELIVATSFARSSPRHPFVLPRSVQRRPAPIPSTVPQLVAKRLAGI